MLNGPTSGRVLGAEDERGPAWMPGALFGWLSRPRQVLVAVALVACAARIGSLAGLGPIVRMEGDVPGYVTPGLRLADGLGYTRGDGTPAMKRPPGFPLQIALSEWLTGNLRLAYILNAVWGSAAVVGVFALGRQAFGGTAVGAVAAALYALLPQSIYWQRQLLSESLHTLLIVIWALTVLRALEKGSAGRFAAAGLILAAVLYVRPASILLIAVPPALALLTQSTRKNATWLLLSSLVSILAILPWTLRNYQVSGRVVPLATGFGVAAYLGNLGDGGNGGFSDDYPGAPVSRDVIREYRAAEVRSDWDADAYARSLVPDLLRDRLRRDPWSWLVNAKLANVSRFFFGKPFAAPSPWWSDLQSAIVLAGLTLTALSFPVLARRRGPQGPLLFCWILTALLSIHVATTSVRRYSEPILPFLALGSAAALLGYGPAWWVGIVGRRRARAAVGAMPEHHAAGIGGTLH